MILQWQEKAYQNALSKGFHSNPDGSEKDHSDPVRIGSRLALIHSEISEALECVARDTPHFWFECEPGQDPAGKPEGLGIELADILIRTCDLAQTLGIRLGEPRDSWRPQTELRHDDPEALGDFLSNCHSWVSSAHTYKEGARENMAQCLDQVVQHLFYLARFLNIDLWKMVELKAAYNETRPHLHGGKRL